MDVLAPDVIPDERAFQNRFVATDDKTKKKMPVRQAELHALLTACGMIRRLKKDVLKQLPAKWYKYIRVKVDEDMGDTIAAQLAKHAPRAGKDDAAVVDMLSEVGREIEAADLRDGSGGGGGGGDDRGGSSRHTQLSAYTKMYADTGDAKFEGVWEYITKLLDAADMRAQQEQKGKGGDKEKQRQFVVFARHQVMMDRLERRLKERYDGKERRGETGGTDADNSVVDLVGAAGAAGAAGAVGLGGASKKRKMNGSKKGKKKAKGSRYIRICGKVLTTKREGLVERFQTDPSCQVALLSIGACSQGLTLTAANTVVFAEL
jgi:hypothetical protein